jgi:hypothetical protein
LSLSAGVAKNLNVGGYGVTGATNPSTLSTSGQLYNAAIQPMFIGGIRSNSGTLAAQPILQTLDPSLPVPH